VETILAFTDAETVCACFQVCSYWENNLRRGKVWRRIIERKFRENLDFRLLCHLTGRVKILPSQGGSEELEERYKIMNYKLTSYDKIWSNKNLKFTQFSTGGLLSCLKLHQNLLYVGLVDGLIEIWDVSQTWVGVKPSKILEGHKERITFLEASTKMLVSSSMDHSLIVWRTGSYEILHILNQLDSPVLSMKLLGDRLICCSKSGYIEVRTWCGPELIKPNLKLRLGEDLPSSNLSIGEEFIAVHDNKREAFIYSCETGDRLSVLVSSSEIHTMEIKNHLLFLGGWCSVEVWDLQRSVCISVLRSTNPPPSLHVSNLSVSDFMLVAFLSNGQILYWPLQKLVKVDTTPFCINIDTFANTIYNQELPWKKPTFSETRIAFGLESSLGDVVVLNWNCKYNKRKLELDNKDLVFKKWKLSKCY